MILSNQIGFDHPYGIEVIYIFTMIRNLAYRISSNPKHKILVDTLCVFVLVKIYKSDYMYIHFGVINLCLRPICLRLNTSEFRHIDPHFLEQRNQMLQIKSNNDNNKNLMNKRESWKFIIFIISENERDEYKKTNFYVYCL